MSELQRVHDDELDFDDDLVCMLDGQPFTGISYDESALGRSEIEYNNGMQQGAARDWYPGGVLRGESYYMNNTLHGIAREYDPKGCIISESCYEFGFLVRSKRFDGAGVVTESYEIDPKSAEVELLNRYRSTLGWTH